MQNLPTDSLYKFSALSGILILLVSVYFPIKMDETVTSKVFEADKTVKESIVEVEYLTKLIDSYDKDLNKMLTKIDELKKEKKPNISEAEKMAKILKKKREKIDNIRKGQEMKRVEISIEQQKIDRLNNQSNIVRIVGIIGNVIGFVLALYGFLNWYFKIQVYQDRIIKKQAE